MRAEVSLHSPEGKVLERRPVEVRDGELNTVLSVKKPKLWSCNGMGEQPLYRVGSPPIHRRFGLG